MEYEAGRELDALIAEKVMGLSLEHLTPAWQEGTTKDGKDGWNGFYCPRCGQASTHTNGMIDGVCAEHYSTDFATALQVLDRVKDTGFSLQYHSTGTHDFYSVILGRDDNTVYTQADTAPLAICLAALRALGLDDEPAG